MSMPFLDAHTHVQFGAYDGDREEVLQRARAQGVRMILVGSQRDTSRRAVELAAKHEGLYAAIGLHPIHTSKSFHDAQELGGGEAAKAFVSRGEELDHAYYLELAQNPKTVAIGECGLDYFHFNKDESREAQIDQQKRAFEAQIALAHEVRKPLMIHCRNAFPDVLAVLRAHKAELQPGVTHFFTGSVEEAKELLELGFAFTFGGVLTFTHDYDEAVKMIPADRLLSETDAPYVAPVPYRGQRNEPAYVVEVVKKLAELKGLSPEQMAAQIEENARRIFGI